MGCSYFLIELALEGFTPLTLVTLRLALAALMLWAAAVAGGLPIPRSPAIWAMFLVMGLLNNVAPFTLISWGQTQIASSLASILNATTPLFGVIIAHAVLADERVTRLKALGVVVGFIGVAVMIGPEALLGLGGGFLGQLAVLIAAASYAVAGAYGRRFQSTGLHPIVIAAGQVSASTLFMIPTALLVDAPFSAAAAPFSAWAGVIALAVFGTALAYIGYFRLLAMAGATNLLLVTFLNPVTVILLGVLLLNEALRAVHIAGMVLIALGLSAIDGRPWRAMGWWWTRRDRLNAPPSDSTQ